MSIQRYSPSSHDRPHEYGHMVRYEDHRAELKKRDAEIAELLLAYRQVTDAYEALLDQTRRTS